MSKEQERKITFGAPVMVGGKETLELTMRRPRIRDQLDAQEQAGEGASQARIELHMFAILCGVSFEDVLDWEVGEPHTKLQEAFVFLTKGGSRKGKTSEKQS